MLTLDELLDRARFMVQSDPEKTTAVEEAPTHADRWHSVLMVVLLVGFLRDKVVASYAVGCHDGRRSSVSRGVATQVVSHQRDVWKVHVATNNSQNLHWPRLGFVHDKIPVEVADLH